MVNIKVLTWNISGAEFLKLKDNAERLKFKRELNSELRSIIDSEHPDFITLQQVVRYGNPSNPEDLVEVPKGYYCKYSISLDNKRQSHPNKWKQIYQAGCWSRDDYLAVGYGLLWSEDIPHCSIWGRGDYKYNSDIPVEDAHLNTGLYGGNRDTEPRLAMVSHFIIQAEGNPLDLYLINLHLTILKGENEEIPERDSIGSRIRLTQIDTVLNEIISRCNEWQYNTTADDSGKLAIWVLAGDFNCVPQSHEVAKIQSMGFLDLNPNKGTGTRANVPGQAATVTLDYIFAGPQYASTTPYIIREQFKNNPKPIYKVAIVNHFPLLAKLALSVESTDDQISPSTRGPSSS
jgi:endonuclease/exonuclease/phosphatase family metal-dependent hydrolase